MNAAFRPLAWAQGGCMAGWQNACLIAASAAGFAATRSPAAQSARLSMDALSSSMMGAKSAWRQSRLLLWLRRRIAQTGAGPAAAAALGALAGGDQVLLRRAENGSDRYGRLFAYAYTLRDGDEFLLQQEPVAEGFARVSTRIANPCAGHLLDRERAAREAKLGLWADPYYEVLNAETPKDALAQRGRFARSRAGRKST
jgi:hypothetical protein